MYILNYIYHFFFSVLRSPLLFDLSHDRSDAASPSPPIDNCIHSSSFFFLFCFLARTPQFILRFSSVVNTRGMLDCGKFVEPVSRSK